MSVRIGELLVELGVLTTDQADHIFELQQHTRRPFGELAEELFGIEAMTVERAWSEQYSRITLWIDPSQERVDPTVLPLLSRRQAWQFGMLPLRYTSHELTLCTTKHQLVRALNFATAEIPSPCYFVLAAPDLLSEALMIHYPMDGMGVDLLQPRMRAAS